MRARGAMVAVLVLLLTALAAGCGDGGQVVDVGAAPTRPAADASTPPPDGAPATEQVSGPDGDGDAPPAGGGGGAGGSGDAQDPGDPGTGGGGGASAPQDTTTLSVYFTQGEQITAVPRAVPRVPRVGAAVLERLLAGPTADEQGAGYGTEIPAATRLRGLTISDGVAVADFSGDFESGGGTLGLTLRLAQVVCTLDQFPTVDGVRFALDGQVVDVFSGDGLIVDEPVSCSDYAANVAG